MQYYECYYEYHWFHILTDKSGKSSQLFVSRLDLLESINKWNRDPRWKYWFLNGNELTEQEFLAQQSGCEGQVVEVNGVKYKLEKT